MDAQLRPCAMKLIRRVRRDCPAFDTPHSMHRRCSDPAYSGSEPSFTAAGQSLNPSLCYRVLVASTSVSTGGATIRRSTDCGFAEVLRKSMFCCRTSPLT